MPSYRYAQVAALSEPGLHQSLRSHSKLIEINRAGDFLAFSIAADVCVDIPATGRPVDDHGVDFDSITETEMHAQAVLTAAGGLAGNLPKLPDRIAVNECLNSDSCPDP